MIGWQAPTQELWRRSPSKIGPVHVKRASPARKTSQMYVEEQDCGTHSLVVGNAWNHSFSSLKLSLFSVVSQIYIRKNQWSGWTDRSILKKLVSSSTNMELESSIFASSRQARDEGFFSWQVVCIPTRMPNCESLEQRSVLRAVS